MQNNAHNPHDLDAATSRRLARLGRRTPDVSALERKLDAALCPQADAGECLAPSARGRRTFLFQSWLRPAAGIAALIAVAATLFLAIGTSTQNASAAVVELSQLHRDLVGGRIPVNAVESVADANAWIASQRASAPALPSQIAGARVQSCCLVDVRGELVAVAVLEENGAAVTLVVAQARDFAHEMGTVIEIDGRRFFGHELDGVRMMMANQDDVWLCVMGNRSYQELAELAAGIDF